MKIYMLSKWNKYHIADGCKMIIRGRG